MIARDPAQKNTRWLLTRWPWLAGGLAMLVFVPDPDLPESRRRPSPILVFDLWTDPDCLDSIHDRRPDLADRYTTFLRERFDIHKSLASRFTRADDSPLTPEQLETLRSLGYIQ